MGIVITHRQMEFWKRNITAVFGMLVFSIGINFFVVPADLYNGGVLGVSQIIRTIFVKYLHLFSGSTDIAGIINMILNIPLFILASAGFSLSAGIAHVFPNLTAPLILPLRQSSLILRSPISHFFAASLI